MYSVKPISLEDRTNINIKVTFNIPKNDSIKIGLPTDNYCAPEIHKFVSKIKSENNTILKNTEEELFKLTFPDKNGKVTLTYIISYDPEKTDQSSFGICLYKETNQRKYTFSQEFLLRFFLC